MVYIDRDGRILEKRPWNLARIIGIFMGIWFLIVHFLRTILAPFRTDRRNGSNRHSGGYSSGGASGGGDGGGSGGGNGGLRPNRHIGRINNSMDINVPGGGCANGQCGG